MKNVEFVAKILAQMIEENRSQHIIMRFIEYLFKTIPLLLLNLNGLIIKIKGKFLKKFGNKKVRTSKRLIVSNKKSFSLQTFSNSIIYGFAEARTAVGLFGVHIWFKI
jgi:ribosomal protein S3